MPKKKLSFCLKIEEARRVCQSNNIKVYPVEIKGFWFIQVDINGKLKTFSKPIGKGLKLVSNAPKYDGVDWTKAIEQTIIHYAEKVRGLNKEKP